MAYGYTKTIQTALKDWTAVAGNAAWNHSSELVCTSSISGLLYIDWGFTAGGTPVGTQFLIMSNFAATGDNGWRVIDGGSLITGTTATATAATDNTEAGPTFECGATVPALGDRVFFWVSGTPANSEIRIVESRVTTGGSESFTVDTATATDMASGNYYTRAESFVKLINLEGIKRLKVICNNNYAASSLAGAWRCGITTTDSVAVIP